MAELDSKFQPPAANYVFLNTYFLTEAKPDPNVSKDFTIARFLHRASTDKQLNKKVSVEGRAVA